MRGQMQLFQLFDKKNPYPIKQIINFKYLNRNNKVLEKAYTRFLKDN